MFQIAYAFFSLFVSVSSPSLFPTLEPAATDTTPYPNALFVHPYVGGPLLKLGMG